MNKRRNRKKKAKLGGVPSPSKTAKIASDPDSFNNMNPSWRISKMEMVDPFGWHKLNSEQINYIREKLSYFESMTWNQISIDGKKQNHSVAIAQLSKETQKRLVEINIIDIDELFSLRLSGRERIWGILDKGVLNLLWWDPNHRVCPSIKKHT